MRLRKVLTTASLVLAGVSSARAELLMCQSCPAGTWSDGTLRECKNCLTTGVEACNSTTGKATSCKAGYGYSNESCSACASGYYSVGGTNACTNPTSIDQTLYTFTNPTQINGTLEANKPYLLVLGGGNGGDNKGHYFSISKSTPSGTSSISVYTNLSGGTGGQGAYLIIPKIDLNYTLASGGKGMNSDEAYAAAGGGGGSWIYLSSGSTAVASIISGGGGGAPSGVPNYIMGSQGGAGGAMGGGGGSGDWDGRAAGRDGGKSGNLAGGSGAHGGRYGGTGAGYTECGNYCGGLGGTVDRRSHGYTPVWSNNTFGGSGGYSVGENYKNATAGITYVGGIYYMFAGNGTSDIVKNSDTDNYAYIEKISNYSSFGVSLCTSCAKLYSLK